MTMLARLRSKVARCEGQRIALDKDAQNRDGGSVSWGFPA